MELNESERDKLEGVLSNDGSSKVLTDAAVDRECRAGVDKDCVIDGSEQKTCTCALQVFFLCSE